MRNQITGLIRTAVPAAWGTAVGWLALRGWVDAELAVEMRGWKVDVTEAAVVVFTAAWYAFARWAEQRLPAWAARLLLGSPKQPTYDG